AGLGALGAAHVGRGGRSRRRVALASTAGLVALLAGGLALAPHAARARLATLVSGRPDASASYRVEAARATLRLLAAHPVAGAGLGAFADTVTAWKRVHGEVRLTHAESDALELAAETGLVGLALLGVLAATWSRGLGERLRRGRDPYRRDVAVAAACAAGALLVHSLFDFNLRLPANALVLAALAALVAAPRAPVPPAGRRRSSRFAAALLLMLAAVAAWRAAGAFALTQAQGAPSWRRIAVLDGVLRFHPYLADAYRERGLAWGRLARASGARLERAERDLLQALRYRPRWAEVRAELAWVRSAAGATEAAARVFAEAVALDPTHRGVGLARAEFLARSQGKEAALLELRRLREADPYWSPAEARQAAQRWEP
ncbi:MAG TPA: O-antigen ligase family protein, partial [Vicinamibacteria bacterium]|nr:O-antigen ligase family protein [Vicinamibacteria bacterium]